jgi:hypothetical protein
MENSQQNNNQFLEPGQAAAKAAVLPKMRQIGRGGSHICGGSLRRIRDSGATGDVKCHDCEQYAWAISIPSNTRLRIYKTTSKPSPSTMKTIAADLGMLFSTFTRER